MSAVVLLLIPVVVVTGSDAFRVALDFTTGVLSLVSLTASVVWGLVASDRLFLTTRQRLLAQGVHRATAVASLGFLLLHVSVKLALAHVTLVEALIPFGAGTTGSSGLIGLGVLAGLLMVTTGVTGALRSSMASPAALATRWRATHMLAYPAWCLALLHGLYAGRPPKAYVVVLYGLCLLGVAGAVALRAAPRTVKRKVAARILAFLDPGPRAPAEVLRTTPPAPRTSPDVLRNTYPEPPPRSAPPPSSPPASAGVGFSAAYRAVSVGPRVEAPPKASPAQLWPAPSPPPPAQAPQSSYDPMYETPYAGVPAYEGDTTHSNTHDETYGGTHSDTYGGTHSDTSHGDTYGGAHSDTSHGDTYGGAHSDTSHGDTYGGAHSDTSHGDTYGGAHSDTSHGDTYGAAHGGVYEADAYYEPPTEPLPGPFQAPASGEPWITPYGGPQ
ncbi:cytochrome b/b6 domain-containing protein [Streptomyces sp. NPDC016845]|uniref:cytochrome b/b6 domain-containing protein n=1 Tax=Streptomyces sp. NPDC016845 TaxID=3364972 RepID=UPI0037BA9848